MPIRAIARHLGISKNTVERALANDRPPKYERPAKGSVVDAVEVQIRELLEETSTMPATVIAERIGWERDDGPQGAGAGTASCLCSCRSGLAHDLSAG
jgi:transposase